MEANKTGGIRSRAVRLKPGGLAALREALDAAWAARGAEERMTREDRARLLDVSVVTAQRIVRGQGVDRSSLLAAFASLNLEWKESYCERVSPKLSSNSAVRLSETQTAPVTKYSRRIRIALNLATLALIGGGILSITFLHYQTAPPRLAPIRGWVIQDAVDRAMKEFDSGRYADAREDIDEAERLARTIGNRKILASAEVVDASLHVEHGDYETARALYQDVVVLRSREPSSIPPLLEDLADLDAKEGRLDDAKRHLADCLKRYKDAGDTVGVALALRDLGSLATQAGDPTDAMVHFEKALANISAAKKPEIVADIEGRRALALRDLHKFPEARRLLQGTLQFWKSRRHDRWIALSLFQLGTVEAASGSASLAVTLFEKSKKLYLKVGDNPGVHLCEDWLKSSRSAASAFAGRVVAS